MTDKKSILIIIAGLQRDTTTPTSVALEADKYLRPDRLVLKIPEVPDLPDLCILTLPKRKKNYWDSPKYPFRRS